MIDFNHFWKPNVPHEKKKKCAESYIDLYYPLYGDETDRQLWQYYKGFVDGAIFKERKEKD